MKTENTIRDWVALVDVCIEQGMTNSQTVAEIRREEACGLREAVGLFQIAAKCSSKLSPERKMQIYNIGKPTLYMGSKESS